jgi:toxoflavin synthase
MHDERSPRALYDATAAGWTRDTPLSLSDFTGRPPTLSLCGDVRGLTLLDLGCGEGYCARELKKRGAGRIFGMDLSLSMVQAARQKERSEPLGIEYDQGDATDLSRFSAESFDLVVAMFLFNYLDVAATERTLSEVHRVLRPGGRLVMAVPHPSLPFLRPVEPPFYFDVGDKGYFTARDGRFPGRIWKRDGTSLEVQVCHKTFQDYFTAFASAGFDHMPTVRELHATPEIHAVDPTFFRPLGETPLHVAFSLVKLAVSR